MARLTSTIASTDPHPSTIHPGEMLLTEFMKPLGPTSYRLARVLEVPAPRIGDVVRGKRSISADTALRRAKDDPALLLVLEQVKPRAA
jgi:addiction module HigA family antidote